MSRSRNNLAARLSLFVSALIYRLVGLLKATFGNSEPSFKPMADNIIMENWPNRRLLDLLKLEIPIIQAPMAGSDSVALARSVSSTGALGSLACALLTPDGVREAARAIRDSSPSPKYPTMTLALLIPSN